jgi:hypothetical protein
MRPIAATTVRLRHVRADVYSCQVDHRLIAVIAPGTAGTLAT